MIEQKMVLRGRVHLRCGVLRVMEEAAFFSGASYVANRWFGTFDPTACVTVSGEKTKVDKFGDYCSNYLTIHRVV